MFDRDMRLAAPRRGAAARRLLAPVALAAGWLALVLAAGGCVPPELLTMRGSLDSLRAAVDTLTVRDSIQLAVLEDTRRDVADQRDILLSTRATAGSTTQEMMDQMTRLQSKLDEVMGRFQRVTERAPVGSTMPGMPGMSGTSGDGAPTDSVAASGAAMVPTGATAAQIYDQAALDLAQGRYDLALEGFREFVAGYPNTELSDNAQYGIGECLFAQAKFDSAAIEYAKVESLYPQGEKVPAALYKLALCHEKLGHLEETKSTLESLIDRYPLSGEAQLARERLGKSDRR